MNRCTKGGKKVLSATNNIPMIKLKPFAGGFLKRLLRKALGRERKKLVTLPEENRKVQFMCGGQQIDERKRFPLFVTMIKLKILSIYLPENSTAVYVGEDVEEPDFQYIPDAPHVSARVPRCDALAESMLLLSEGLESGAAMVQFEQLYRKKPGMTMNIARLPENLAKNRYRDISPYDVTRVILQGSLSGDYINASHVNMEIPTSGIVNRYIATQGPLPHTCTDFWQMIWEQQSTLIVMVTTLMERGRVKCHKYWPDLYETAEYGHLQVTCLGEEESPSFVFRELTLINTQVSEERHITHMQYLSWPDHGVPDDATDFLHFVTQVRHNRAGMVESTVVHCSAGIGRTGVLILMETAMCLIEANEPIYPLDIVKSMRDQRAMLIQTSSQYRFVCEAVLKVYNDGIVKPLSEYQT